MNRVDFDQLPFLMALKRNRLEELQAFARKAAGCIQTPCCGKDCFCDVPEGHLFTACRNCGSYFFRTEPQRPWYEMDELNIIALETWQLQQCASRLIEAGWK